MVHLLLTLRRFTVYENGVASSVNASQARDRISSTGSTGVRLSEQYADSGLTASAPPASGSAHKSVARVVVLLDGDADFVSLLSWVQRWVPSLTSCSSIERNICQKDLTAVAVLRLTCTNEYRRLLPARKGSIAILRRSSSPCSGALTWNFCHRPLCLVNLCLGSQG